MTKKSTSKRKATNLKLETTVESEARVETPKELELVVEKMYYGWRVQLPLGSSGAETETNREAQRVNSDPYGVMRLISVTDFDDSKSRLGILTYCLYHRIKGEWKSIWGGRLDCHYATRVNSCKDFNPNSPISSDPFTVKAFELLLKAE